MQENRQCKGGGVTGRLPGEEVVTGRGALGRMGESVVMRHSNGEKSP